MEPSTRASPQAVELHLYSSGSLRSPVPPEKLACSPTLDLLVCVDRDNAVSIRRAKGEVVSKPAKRNGAEVRAVRWKPDGQYVAVAWSDGVVRLMGIESTKTLHEIASCLSDAQSQQEADRIVFVAWSRNLAGQALLQPGKPLETRPGGAWADMLPRAAASGGSDGLSLDEQKEIADLPRQITFLEVEASLPKISPLPVSGGSGLSGDDIFVFSSRASLEFVFREFRPEDADKVDVMIVGTDSGALHLTICDTFDVGVFRYALPARGVSRPTQHRHHQQQQQQQQRESALRLVNHTSHPDVSTHSLLLRPPGEAEPEELFLVPMDLCFVYSSPINLSLLASKITTLQKLLRYMHQTQTHMASEWNSARELPARFLANVSEDLKEASEGPRDIMGALYHTVLTGHAHPVVKEWLVDSVAERGHKRWDKAVTSGLENLRSLLHENMLPALDRCAVILSRLLGIARFHDDRRSDIGFSATQISRLVDVVSCLSLVGNRLLVHVMDELELFATFSAWLRFQIDRLASSSSAASGGAGADELTEREATLDSGRVLEYISTYLARGTAPPASAPSGRREDTGSRDSVTPAHPASMFFGPIDEPNFRKGRHAADEAIDLLDLLDRQIRGAEQGLPHMQALPRVDFLVDYLRSKAQTVFDAIAEAERRSVRFGRPTRFDVGGPVAKHDMRLGSVGKPENGIDGQTFSVLAPRDRQNELYIFRTTISIANGISTAVETDVCALSLSGGKVIDFSFLNSDVVIILWHPKGETPFLFSLAVKGPEITYVPYSEENAPVPREINVQDLMDTLPRMYLSSAINDESRGGTGTSASTSGPFVPIWMEVKEPSNARGHVPARVCLLGQDMVTYKVFILPEVLYK